MKTQLFIRFGLFMFLAGCMDVLVGGRAQGSDQEDDSSPNSASDIDTDGDTTDVLDISTEPSQSTDIDTDFAGITSGVPAHRWRFNQDLNDGIGQSDAAVVTPLDAEGENVYLTGEAVYLEGGPYQEAQWISLGTELLNENGGAAVSIELFATLWSVDYFTRIFEFGSSGWECLMMTWSYESDGTSDLVFWWDETPVSQLDTNAPYILGQEYHIVMIVDPGGGTNGAMRITWYTAPSDATDILPAAGFLETTDLLTDLRDIDCWLGKSHSTTDPVAHASYNDVRIWWGALSETDIEKLHELGPDI